MIDKKSSIIPRLKEYEVESANEAVMQKTITAGKQLIMQNRTQGLCLHQRIFNQLRYISPLLWGAEGIAVISCVLLISQINTNTDITLVLSSLSFFMALLGIAGFPELCKSFSCQMWELEQSCKYNLRQLVSLKLAIIGMIDLVLVLVIASATSIQIGLPLWEAALYLFVPFNLSCIVAFFLVGFTRNKGLEWLFFPAGLGVAFFALICINRFSLYTTISISAWTIAFVATIVILGNRIFYFLKNVEQGGIALCS